MCIRDRPEQDQAWQRSSSHRQQLAKVRVGGHQNSILETRGLQDVDIVMTCEVAVDDVADIVPSLREQGSQSLAEALIEQEPHADVRSGTCRSATAIAANSRAALTSPETRVGLSLIHI